MREKPLKLGGEIPFKGSGLPELAELFVVLFPQLGAVGPNSRTLPATAMTYRSAPKSTHLRPPVLG
ncbi:MAG: hypothetical protein O7G32_01055, partial [SAR324 cluster bacterium]|nr:hypothetical protein [SAR324 cluster bacterium]